LSPGAGALLAAAGALPSCGLQAASAQAHNTSAAVIELNKRIPFAPLKNKFSRSENGASYADSIAQNPLKGKAQGGAPTASPRDTLKLSARALRLRRARAA
jgi:hypothetical protein